MKLGLLPPQCVYCLQASEEGCPIFEDANYAWSKPGGCSAIRTSFVQIEHDEYERHRHLKSRGILDEHGHIIKAHPNRSIQIGLVVR